MEATDQQAIAILEGLVRIASPSCDEAAAARYCVEAMAALGLRADIDPAGSPVGRIGAGPRRILLLGHIDTVAGQIPVRQEHGCLYGRGSVDAKGPLATFIAAAARVGVLPGWEITVVGAVEEECATSAGAYHVVATYPVADYVIIGEPSGWQRVTLGYKGRLLVDYVLERPMSHTAGEARGACEEAVDYWLAVRAWAERYNAQAAERGQTGRFATLDPSLRAINSSSDGLTERVELGLGLRLPLELDLATLEAALREAAGAAAIHTRAHELPFRAEKRGPLPAAFLAAIRAQGGEPAFLTKTGTSDMNVIGPAWGKPIIAYGPGDSALDHTPDEHIVLDEYLAAIRVLEGALRRLAAV